MKYLLAFLLITGLSHGQGSIKDEIKSPPPYLTAEIEALRSIPPSDPKLIKRLLRVDDNFPKALNPFRDNLDKGLRIPEVFWENYTELYQDKKDGAYYVGIFRRASDDEIRGLKKVNWGKPKPKTSKKRLVVISNLSPSLSLIADAADWGELYIRQIVPTYDFYKGYLRGRGYLYSDPSNQNSLKLTPITNKETGGVAYKGVSPNSGRTFYIDRFLGRYGDFSYDLSSSGTLLGLPADTLEEIWERQKPDDDPVWDI